MNKTKNATNRMLKVTNFHLFCERFIKEILCGYFTGLATIVNKSLNDKRNLPLRIGLISQEFFLHEQGGGGGFAETVRNLTNYYNRKTGPLNLNVIMPSQTDFVIKPVLRRFHQCGVIMLPSLPWFILHALLYMKLLQYTKPSCLITIDYLTKYEYVLWGAPAIPLIIYIRDPRARDEWNKIASVPLEISANNRHDKNSLINIVEQHAASFKRLLRWSRWFKRKVIFATNAEFLIERARRKFRLKQIHPYYLPNPIPIPELKEIQYCERPMLLFLGRIAPVKRPWIIFELAKLFPQVEWVIAGQMSFSHLMKEIIKKYAHLPNLKFLGYVGGREKANLLNRCWAVINTSIHEGLPVSFIEAFSYGKCVISCQNPDGLVERFGFFTGNFQGDGLEKQFLDAFSEKIKECLNNEEGRRSKGKRARRYVEQTHTFENFNTRLLKILESEDILDTHK